MKKVTVLLSSIALIMALSSCGGKKQSSTPEASNAEAPMEVKSKPSSSDEAVIYAEMSQDLVENLNAIILDEGLTTPEAILAAYAPKDNEAEGNYSYQVEPIRIDGILVGAELTEEGLMDDSLYGRKVRVSFTTKDGRLQVLQIEESYKCREGRGHQSWSPEFCN